MHASTYYDVDRTAWLLVSESKRKDSERGEPEEFVRQWCLHELLRSYGTHIGSLKIEQKVRVGTRTHRADIVILQENRPWAVVECKSREHRKHQQAMDQAVSYATAAEMNAEYAAYTNGEVWWVRRHVRGQWVSVPDLPYFGNVQVDTSWRDMMEVVSSSAAVMFWLDQTVPAKAARDYFGALQRFFYGTNLITEGTNDQLRWAADNFLRVLNNITGHPNYLRGKFEAGCEGLNTYWETRGVTRVFGGGDFEGAVHHARGVLSNLMDDQGDGPILDSQALRLILSLLDYLNRMRGARPKYQDVGSSIQREVRDYLDLALRLSLHAHLPDIQDRISGQDIRDYCQPHWDSFTAQR